MSASARFWADELAHRADSPEVVRAALGLGEHDAEGAEVARLLALDPVRDRPLLDEDPDGAVFIDIVLAPLADHPDEYAGVRQWPHAARPLEAVRTLMRREALYATPECRVRLDGRARYNLAFDAAAMAREESPRWTR